MNIYITRHGETRWNTEGRCQGSCDSNLTENGIKDAMRLGERVNDIRFDAIYSSPLKRALDTAKYIRGNKETKIIIDDNLKEINFGVWEGMTFDEIKENYPDQYNKVWNKPELYEPVDGETIQYLMKRVKKVLDEIIKSNHNEDVLIVTHAFVLKAIFAIVKGYTIEHFWDPPFASNTCLSIIEVKEDGMNFILEADVSHLG